MKPDVDSSRSRLGAVVKVAQVLLTLLFAYSLSVQFNDPDPALWCSLYGGAILVSLLDLTGAFRNRWLIGAQGVVYLIVMVFWMLKFWPWGIEEQREIGGLFLLASWALLSCWAHREGA